LISELLQNGSSIYLYTTNTLDDDNNNNNNLSPILTQNP
jgi:hypothetical protein